MGAHVGAGGRGQRRDPASQALWALGSSTLHTALRPTDDGLAAMLERLELFGDRATAFSTVGVSRRERHHAARATIRRARW